MQKPPANQQQAQSTTNQQQPQQPAQQPQQQQPQQQQQQAVFNKDQQYLVNQTGWFQIYFVNNRFIWFWAHNYFCCSFLGLLLETLTYFIRSISKSARLKL